MFPTYDAFLASRSGFLWLAMFPLLAAAADAGVMIAPADRFHINMNCNR
jgi:hypothetical protein